MRQAEYEAITEDRCVYCGGKPQARISDKPEYACIRCFSRHHGKQYHPNHPDADANGYITAARFLKSAPRVSNERAANFCQAMREMLNRKAAGGVQARPEEQERTGGDLPGLQERVQPSMEATEETGLQGVGRMGAVHGTVTGS